MGRYISGDINRKSWFGVQSSSDADFFGQEGTRPSELEYYYDKDDLPSVQEGLATCLKELGKYKQKLDDFFKDIDGYTDQMLVESLEISKEKVSHYLEWYARYELGKDIEKCLLETGECNFTSEL